MNTFDNDLFSLVNVLLHKYAHTISSDTTKTKDGITVKTRYYFNVKHGFDYYFALKEFTALFTDYTITATDKQDFSVCTEKNLNTLSITVIYNDFDELLEIADKSTIYSTVITINYEKELF